MGKRKRVRSKKGADHANRANIIHTNGTVLGDRRDGASTSGGSNAPLDNNEGGVSNFPRKKKVRGKKLKKAKKVEKTDLVQTSSSTMVVKTHGSNGSSSELAEKCYTDDYMETVTVENEIAGYIFMCSEKTKYDCYRYRVFGLPAGKLEVVKKIRKGAKLFLYDFNLKILHGLYTASSDGEKNLEAYAFGGSFAAQVKFNIFKECIPLPEKVFNGAIKENYSGKKFDQELNLEQVRKLFTLFQQIPPAPGRDLVSSFVTNHARLLPGYGQRVELPLHQRPYVAGVPCVRMGYQVVPPGQHPGRPHLVAAGRPPQQVEHHPLQHDHHQRYGAGLHEMGHMDQGVAVEENRYYPAAYAGRSGEGENIIAGNVRPQPAIQNLYNSNPSRAFPGGNPSASFSSHPPTEMNCSLLRAPAPTLNYYPAAPPWYQR